MSLSATLPLARRGFGIVLAGAALILALAVLVPALLGYQRYVITSGSMTGTYDRGSLVFDKVVPTSSLRAGDVITFRPPGHAGLVTHRIRTLTSVDGKRVLTTKGDANRAADAWGPIALRRAARRASPSTFPTSATAWPSLSEKRVRMLVIGLPALLIALERPGRPVARLRPGRASAVGMIRVLVLLAALLAAAAAVQGSQATFTASKTNPGSSFVTAAKFPPTVTLTAPANGSATNDTTPTLSGAAGNATRRLARRSPSSIYSGTPRPAPSLQTHTADPHGTTWTTTATTALAAGHLHRAGHADRHLGQHRARARPTPSRSIRPSPTALSIAAANKTGGTAGKIENGDTLTFTYSEPITAASVWSGWNGASTRGRT